MTQIASHNFELLQWKTQNKKTFMIHDETQLTMKWEDF